MKKFKNWQWGALILSFLFIVSCKKQVQTNDDAATNATRLSLLNREPTTNLSASVHVFAEHLNNPRGLKFGPDGNLYVAEGGLGGSTTTSSTECDQVPSPIGPYSGGMTARISR